MKIYRAGAPEASELVHPIDDSDWETFDLKLNGTSQKDGWKPIAVRLVKQEYDGTPWTSSLSPWLGGHSLVFKQDAAIKLGRFLVDTGELLPLVCDEEPLYVWQPLCVVDAVDIDSSDVWRFKDGRLSYINRYAFIENKLEDVDAFKVPNLRVRGVFFSERAVQTIASVISSGLRFDVVWDSEKKPLS
jgi:hypothetical protein